MARGWGSMSAETARLVSRNLQGPRPGFAQQMRYGMLTYGVLALINEAPNYGRALVDALYEIPGMATSDGAIYPLLRRLSRQGLLTTSPSPTRCRYYRVTAEGRVALQAFGRGWLTMRNGLEQVLARVEEAGS